MRVWHGRAHPPGYDVGRSRRQRRGLLGAGHPHRAVLVRLRGSDEGKRTVAPAGPDRAGLARVLPGSSARAAVRVARRRALRPPARTALQCQQAAVRPPREGGRPGPGLFRCALRIQLRQRAEGSVVRHQGQRRLGAAGGGHRRRVRLGSRHVAAARARRHGDLRAACQGFHHASTPVFPRAFAVPTPGWPRRPRSSISSGWASTRWNCCPCTTGRASGSSSRKG